jgi:hypothetical protein
MDTLTRIGDAPATTDDTGPQDSPAGRTAGRQDEDEEGGAFLAYYRAQRLCEDPADWRASEVRFPRASPDTQIENIKSEISSQRR